MDYTSIYYPESRFGGFPDIDGTIIFYSRVNALANPSSIILDIGCGRGSHIDDPISFRKSLRIMKDKCNTVIGIDVDESARENPFLDKFYKIEDAHWPIGDQSIDLAICDAVLEHYETPDLFFSECSRVIKPGGFLCIRTGNLLGYAAIISKVIPARFHYKILRQVQKRREDDDIFPTYFRCNTIRKMRKMLDKYNFDNYTYGYEAEPAYLSFSRFYYWLGVMHQKFAPNIIKLAIYSFSRKIY